MDAEKEERKRRRAEGKGKGSGTLDEEEKPKLEELEGPHGLLENGDVMMSDRR